MSYLTLEHEIARQEGLTTINIDKTGVTSDLIKTRLEQKKLLMKAQDILSKNRITAPMLYDITADNVAHGSSLYTPHPDAEHRFNSYNEGDVDTLVLLDPHGDAVLIYVDFEITDLSASDAVTIRPIAAGSLTPSDNEPGQDPYLVEEFDLSEINEIILSADEPLTADDLYKHWWYRNTNFHEIGMFVIALQNWAFKSEVGVVN